MSVDGIYVLFIAGIETKPPWTKLYKDLEKTVLQ